MRELFLGKAQSVHLAVDRVDARLSFRAARLRAAEKPFALCPENGFKAGVRVRGDFLRYGFFLEVTGKVAGIEREGAIVEFVDRRADSV